jgi:hypothetical protein
MRGDATVADAFGVQLPRFGDATTQATLAGEVPRHLVVIFTPICKSSLDILRGGER